MSLHEALNTRDVARMLKPLPTDCEWQPAIGPGGIEGETYVGHAGAHRSFQNIDESWQEFEAVALSLRQVDNRRTVWEVRDGKYRKAGATQPQGSPQSRGAAGVAMSHENVDVMRRIVEAAGRQDYQAVLVDLDPKVEIDDTDIPESTGADSFVQWLARWDAVWESWHVKDLEVRAAGEEQAIALFTMVARGRASGIELARPDALVASFRGGKAVKLGYYNDQAQALDAVGLRE